VWTAITGQFFNNNRQCVMFSQPEFHNLFQDNMSVASTAAVPSALPTPSTALSPTSKQQIQSSHHQALHYIPATKVPLHQILFVAGIEPHEPIPPNGSPDGASCSSRHLLLRHVCTGSDPPPSTSTPSSMVTSSSDGDLRKKHEASNNHTR